MKQIVLKKIMDDNKAERLKMSFMDASNYNELITEDCDAHDVYGNLLLKFRKGVLPLETLKLGYESFKDSIDVTESRGAASGSSHKRIRADGTIANTTVGNKVSSGNVGYMDSSAMIRYCRKTAFASRYFETFKQGIPFVQYIDKLYSELAPEHYTIQKNWANRTNRNYVIENTAFTTVTVNKNFRTAVHKDAGDLPEGFGNLIVYKDDSYTGGYFVLPQYGIAVDLQNTDVLFVDVHQWHGNTEMKLKEGFAEMLRISFVLYYRQYMAACKSPSEELKRIKMDQTGYLKL